MATSNEIFLDSLTRHQIELLRFSKTTQNKIIALLDKTDVIMSARIRSILKAGTGLTTPAQVKRLDRLLVVIDSIRLDAWREGRELLNQEMIALAKAEPVIVDGLIKASLPVVIQTELPSAALLKNIAIRQPFRGRLLKQWASTAQAADLAAIKAVIQAGMVAGDSIDSMVRGVIGTKAFPRIGATQAARHNIEAIVRTAVMHISNASRREFYLLNTDIINVEQFVATLDSGTTAVCRANDNELFELGEGPQPPLHVGCRSLRIPAMDDEELSERPAQPFTEKQLLREFAQENKLGKITNRNQLPRGTKGKYDLFKRGRLKELVGPVPASTSYSDFLRRQSVANQEDILGIAKSKLFREGNLTLDKFVDQRGKELTLRQLALKHEEAFKAAGLDVDDYLKVAA